LNFKQTLFLKSMKLLCYADLQATDGDELCFTKPNTTLQHYRTQKFFKDIAEIYTAEGCDGIVDLGDTTDDRSSIPMTTVEVLGSGIAGLPDCPRWKLTGNHEQYLRDASVNNRRLFDHSFTVVDRYRHEIVDDVNLLFASYPGDYKKLCEWIDKKLGACAGPVILFGHFEIEGSFFNNAKALTGVPQKLLSACNLVLMGHIHMPQSLTSKIHYIGSPFQQDWGEAGQDKRVAIVDTDTCSVKWVPLTGYPQYRTLSLTEFMTSVGTASEDRYRVVLTSHDESEQFFRHPLFNRAVAEYKYEEQAPEEQTEQTDFSFEGTLRRYLKSVPPSKVGISLNEDEMIEMSGHVLNG
jgi:hypothetical protein